MDSLIVRIKEIYSKMEDDFFEKHSNKEVNDLLNGELQIVDSVKQQLENKNSKQR